MKITLVIPCYNEEKRLKPELVLSLVENPNLNLLLVNDGSSDKTALLIEDIARHSTQIQTYSLPMNQGKAEAIRTGMLMAIESKSEWIGFTDADFATPPSEIHRLTNDLPEIGQNILLGSRVQLLGSQIERKPLRHYLGRVFATIASLQLNLRVYDTQCGMKYFRNTECLQKSLQRPFTSRWIFDVELIGRLIKNGQKSDDFLEIPLRQWRDVAGSKLKFTSMLKAFVELLLIRKNF